MQNLFKPFFQAEAAGPRTIGGTGLGLPGVQRLCMRMGGDIAVTSQRGVGTSISVALRLLVLPASEEEAAEAGMEEGASAEPLAERERFNILVVDDHPANRLLMQRQLGFLGFRSSTAEDGKVALALWQKENFDVVITDCSMPVMGGYALTSAIRAIEGEKKLPHCPVLGCTAHVQEQEQERRRALDVGMDECLMKPLSVDALLEALRRHLSEGSAAGPAPMKSGEGEGGGGAQEGAAFDRSSLQEFSGGDAKLEASFLEALLRTNLSDMEELQGLLQSGAGREVASRAHKIKGAARIVRAERVVRDCEAVEAASDGGDAAGLAGAIADLQRSLGEFNDAMSRQLQVYASLAH
ncbi:MAG TPA: response regulator [Variovorax sp.]|nr:response regulator [Variovorax sp.]